ncbi:hypothetical protein DFH07DRAFT_786020 [Mycena maculata]|uniref:Uncharacterized protein n=1 Tax=Mycena maculata TaxID=230809 RepID=A0AAD7ME94_9AGAR|nr:hypothetical protein DFH07DRAFT_786020 [Mycena maculata]
MPPRYNVQTRSKSIPKQPLPTLAVTPLPASASPDAVATSGYPDRPKTALSGLHFGRNTGNTYTASKVEGKSAARAPSTTSSFSTASSNAFDALTDLDDTNTVEEQMTLDLLGLPSNAFVDSPGGDISSSVPPGDVSPPKDIPPPTDPIALLARHLARPRPSTPPGTTSGAGSSASGTDPSPELGCTQNTDGLLRDAADIQFFLNPDDDTPMPAVPRAPTSTSTVPPPGTPTTFVTSGAAANPSAFLAPTASATPASAAGPGVLNLGAQDTNIAEAVAAAGRARQARAAATPLPASPVTATEPAAVPLVPTAAQLPTPTGAPLPTPTAAPLPAPTATTKPPTPSAIVLPVPVAAPQPAPTTEPLLLPALPPALTVTATAVAPPMTSTIPPPSSVQAATQPTVDPSFSGVVTRSQARRTAAGAPIPSTLPFGMFIPSHAPPAPITASSNPSTITAGHFPPLPQTTNAAQPPTTVAPVGPPPPVQPLPGAQPPAPAPGIGAAGAAATGITATGAAAMQTVPAAAAAALNATPLPVLCPVPINVPGLYSPDRITAYDNVSPTHLSNWDALTGGKFLVYEWNGRSHSLESTTVEDLKSAITRITGTIPLVGPPVAANPSNRSSPFMYLVRGISDADTQRLLARRIWNVVGRQTFFAVPYDAPSSIFLFTLDGFSFTADDGVDSSMVTRQPRPSSLSTTTPTPPAADADPMAHFAASVRVSPIHLKNAGGRTRVAWNVTAAPPSADVTNNRAWVAALSALTFDSTMHWEGRAISPPLFCSGCKSPGHNIALCPLPKLPGWYTKPVAPSTGSSSGSSGGGNSSGNNGGNGNGNGRARGPRNNNNGNQNNRNRGRNNQGGQ